MQVRHQKLMLHFICKSWRFWTRRAKRAVLGLRRKLLTRKKKDGARCATCIFNFHRGPLGTFDRMIYSEIGLCIICGFGGVMKPARGPRTFGLAAQDVHTIIKVIPHDPQQRHLRARPHSPATHIRNRRATWKQRKHYGDAEQSKNWGRTSNTMMLKKGGPSRHERFQ